MNYNTDNDQIIEESSGNLVDNLMPTECQEYWINITPEFIKSIYFISQFAAKVMISENTISSSNLTIQIQNLSNCNVGVSVKDLIEVIKNYNDVVKFCIKDSKLIFRYTRAISDTFDESTKRKDQVDDESKQAEITKYLDLFNLDFKFNISQPLLVLRIIKDFDVLSNDETTLTYEGNTIRIETFGYVKTRNIIQIEKVEGDLIGFEIKIRGEGIRIIADIEGEKLLSYHKDYLVVYGIENNITTACIIRSL